MQLKTFILAVLKWVASLTELSRIPPGVAIQIQAVGFWHFFVRKIVEDISEEFAKNEKY